MKNSKTQTSKKVDVETRFEKNHSKSIRYRLRVQQDRESKQELKDYEHKNKVPD